MGELRIRAAGEADVETVAAFVRKKFEFDRAGGSVSTPLSATPESLHAALCREPAFAHVLLVEDDAGPLGFALYYFRFSSFAGRPSVWLDDLYVDQPRRRGGAGKHLMRRLARIAERWNCTHLAWTANEHNVEGMSFYRKLCTEVTDHRGTTVTLRITPEALLAGTADVTGIP